MDEPFAVLTDCFAFSSTQKPLRASTPYCSSVCSFVGKHSYILGRVYIARYSGSRGWRFFEKRSCFDKRSALIVFTPNRCGPIRQSHEPTTVRRPTAQCTYVRTPRLLRAVFRILRRSRSRVSDTLPSRLLYVDFYVDYVRAIIYSNASIIAHKSTANTTNRTRICGFILTIIIGECCSSNASRTFSNCLPRAQYVYTSITSFRNDFQSKC